MSFQVRPTYPFQLQIRKCLHFQNETARRNERNASHPHPFLIPYPSVLCASWPLRVALGVHLTCWCASPCNPSARAYILIISEMLCLHLDLVDSILSISISIYVYRYTEYRVPILIFISEISILWVTYPNSSFESGKIIY